jgi:photosystem II stability/assembly factor-like uncharacterized protein
MTRLIPKTGRFAAGLMLVVSCFSIATSDSFAQAPEAKKEIAELEKQIAELEGKLKTLKSSELPIPKTAGNGTLPTEWITPMKWRSIGPANMGGRIVSLSVFDADPTYYFIATASGGLLKTTNNGSTFEHCFDREATVSIGSVAIAPSNKNIVWVGTGEANPRNSVSMGDGVYKSIDGGKTWQNMGLKKSYQVGSIVIHPTNPEVVYVAALGRLYGPNEERGLYKTTDGGKTWSHVLKIDANTGVMEIAMNPKNPELLIVASWDRARDEFDSFLGDSKAPEAADEYAPSRLYSASTGLWKTTDGGMTFSRLTQGLPTAKMGRIGLDWSRSNPNTIFAIIDTENAGLGLPPSNSYMGMIGETTDTGVKFTTITEGGPAEKAGLKVGDFAITAEGVALKTYEDLLVQIRKKKPNDELKLTILRGKDKKDLVVKLGTRPGNAQNQPRPSLGAEVEEADEGVKLIKVEEKGPAAKAGLKADDIITEIDGQKAENTRSLGRTLFSKKLGEKVKITYLRAKEAKSTEMTLEVFSAKAARPNTGPADLGGQRANVQDQQGPEGVNTGGLYKSMDAGQTWVRINSINPRPFYFSVVRVDPLNEKNIWVHGVDLAVSTDGGVTFKEEFTIPGSGPKPESYSVNRGVHSDQHAMWINPKDSRHILLGSDGGTYLSYDQGRNWEHLNYLALGQFYHVAVDNRKPYRVYGGLQDNGSWGGPSDSLRSTGPVNEDFINVLGGDGFVCRIDPIDPDIVYAESQNGRIMRKNLKTNQSTMIRPRSVPGLGTYRWNWNTPFILSSANPRILYCAANYVFRSVKQGDNLKPISPEITRTKRGSATALAESPRNSDVLWVGSDDGAVWVTKDGGKTWTDVSKNFLTAGLPGPRWVSSIETSKAADGRAYVVFDAHRSNDDEPYIFVTQDYGTTWKSLKGNLPTGWTRVVREDITNPDLLYLGTEFGAYLSLNRGQTWTRINGDSLPTVAIHEIAQPTTANEIVVATHGRSLWVLDVTTLRQFTESFANKPETKLFSTSEMIRWRLEYGKEGMFSTGTRNFKGTNPSRIVSLDLMLDKKPTKVSLKVNDIQGKLVRDLEVKSAPGFQRINWDMRRAFPRPLGINLPPGSEAGALGRGVLGPQVPAGIYRLVLTVDEKEFSQLLTIENDPRDPEGSIATDDAGTERIFRKAMGKEAMPDGDN